MDKYLLELLKEVNTIIIPGLGALSIIDADKGEIMFMPYLKHDDGKLSGYIAEKEGMEVNDASNLIAKYVREILNTMDKGETYDMYQFGSFFKNDSGDIEFQSWKSKKLNVTQTETKEVPIVKRKTEEEKIEEEKPNEEVVIPTPTTAEEAPAEEQTEEIETASTEYVAEEEEEELIEDTPVTQEEPAPEVNGTFEAESKEEEQKEEIIITEEEPQRELNILEKEERAATQAKLDKLREDKNKPVKKKRGVGFYAMIVFALIVISFSTYIIVDFDGASKLVPFLATNEEAFENKSSKLDEMADILGEETEYAEADTLAAEIEAEQITEQTEESNVEEETAEERAVVEPKQSTPPVALSTSSGYHIIVGAFSNQGNAERLAGKLNSEGQSAKLVEENGLFKVSLGTYSTKDEAKQALSSMNLSMSAIIHRID